MATTNLLPWNPTSVNQESDAEYLADSQRAGGATNPSIFDARLANKAFGQWSAYLTALFQAFANKGFTTSDSNLNTLTATCAAFLTTADKISVVTASGGPLISATQAGSSYGGPPNNAAILAATQGGDANYLFAGVDSGGVARFWVQAGGLISATAIQLSTFISAASATIGGAVSAASATIGGLLSAGSVNIGGLLQTASAIVSGAFQAASATISGNLNAGSLQIGGGAPAGQVLTGNGATYVPQPLPAAPVLSVVVSDVTGARSFGTTYQNTSSGFMVVSGYGHTAGSSVGSMHGLIGPGSPTSTAWADTVGGTVDNGACGFNFTVPPGWFYQINANDLTNGQGSAVNAVGSWLETTVSI